jgi:prepilin-type N-terminal cleavage/methylation domain-containing protein
MRIMNQMKNGFTLVELLVSLTIFGMIAIGLYYFYDRGRWMYLQSERRANLQENGRLAMEAMEREMRLIGFGVPTGTEIGSNITFNPVIFEGDDNMIGFRGDVDTWNSFPTDQSGSPTIAGGASSISVEYPNLACPINNIPLLIVERGSNWQSTTCTGRSSTAINIAPGVTKDFAVSETEIFSPLHVFYRFSPDTNGDSICDQATTSLPDYTQCVIERAEERSLTPIVDPTNPSTWQTFATNIKQFRLRYFRKDAGSLTELAVPLDSLSNSVDVIRVEITATDRSDRARQAYQDAEFRTEILVRKRRY